MALSRFAMIDLGDSLMAYFVCMQGISRGDCLNMSEASYLIPYLFSCAGFLYRTNR